MARPAGYKMIRVRADEIKPGDLYPFKRKPSLPSTYHKITGVDFSRERTPGGATQTVVHLDFDPDDRERPFPSAPAAPHSKHNVLRKEIYLHERRGRLGMDF